jgi:hypothetical protein
MAGWQETIRLISSVWFFPRKAVRRILDEGLPWPYLLPFVFIFGISFTMDQFSFRELADFFDLTDLLLIALLLGIGIGPLFWMIYSGVFFGLGRLCRGRGRWRDVQSAVAAAMVPSTAKLVFWMMQLVIFGEETWKEFTPRIDTSFFLLVAFFFFLLIDLIFTVWTIVILAGAVSAAHRFPLWMGILMVFFGVPLVWAVFKYGFNIVIMPM